MFKDFKVKRLHVLEQGIGPMPEYNLYVQAVRNYQSALSSLQENELDVRDLQKKLEKIEDESRMRLRLIEKNDVPVRSESELLYDRMNTTAAIEKFKPRISEARLALKVSEEKLLEAYNNLAAAYDEKFLKEKVEHRERLINELKRVDRDLFIHLCAINDKTIRIDGSPVPEFSCPITERLEITFIGGYERWRENIANGQ